MKSTQTRPVGANSARICEARAAASSGLHADHCRSHSQQEIIAPGQGKTGQIALIANNYSAVLVSGSNRHVLGVSFPVSISGKQMQKQG